MKLHQLLHTGLFADVFAELAPQTLKQWAPRVGARREPVLAQDQALQALDFPEQRLNVLIPFVRGPKPASG